jgi:hypothetical protein
MQVVWINTYYISHFFVVALHKSHILEEERKPIFAGSQYTSELPIFHIHHRMEERKSPDRPIKNGKGDTPDQVLKPNVSHRPC